MTKQEIRDGLIETMSAKDALELIEDTLSHAEIIDIVMDAYTDGELEEMIENGR